MAKDVKWHWMDHQDQAFQRIRQLVTEAPVLKYYEPTEERTLMPHKQVKVQYSLKTESPLHLPVEPRPDMPR